MLKAWTYWQIFGLRNNTTDMDFMYTSYGGVIYTAYIFSLNILI
jgi:hypothetical protein